MEKSSSNDPRDLTLGCGSNTENNMSLPPITLNISTTTGGSFSVDVESNHTVEHLKKIIAKKLKVAKDRICLLHRERYVFFFEIYSQIIKLFYFCIPISIISLSRVIIKQMRKKKSTSTILFLLFTADLCVSLSFSIFNRYVFYLMTLPR